MINTKKLMKDILRDRLAAKPTKNGLIATTPHARIGADILMEQLVIYFLFL